MHSHNSWLQSLNECADSGESCVLVTILSHAGSAPRDQGTKMLVKADSIADTIGGGHLEYVAIKTARAMLATGKPAQKVEHFPLASKLGQCCGGAVNLLFEVFIHDYQPLAIFGAGHVAKALIPIVAQLPFSIQWIDQREAMFDVELSRANVSNRIIDEPADHVSELPESAWLVVLTHNHQLDYDIVHNALKRHDIPFVGMIGSETKSRRFRSRLVNQGLAETALERFCCPVGDRTVPGKRPIEVAVSISAQLIQRLHKAHPEPHLDSRQQWLTTKQLAGLK